MRIKIFLKKTKMLFWTLKKKILKIDPTGFHSSLVDSTGMWVDLLG